jgi:hypothetical protein
VLTGSPLNKIYAGETLAASLEFGTTPTDLTATASTIYTAGSSSIRFGFNRIESSQSYDQTCFGSFLSYYGLQFPEKGSSFDTGMPDQSYMFIENLGAAPIKRVEIMTSSSGIDSDLYCDFMVNDEGTDVLADDMVNSTVIFTSQSYCKQVSLDFTTYDIKGINNFKPYDYKDIKTVRLTRTLLTGDTKNGVPLITAVYVYTEDTPTGIFNMDSPFFAPVVSNGELNMGEPVSVIEVYTVTGKQLRTARNTDGISLYSLPSGVYIVKAVSETGKTRVMKITR